MIFSPTSQYALRALIYLATHDGAGPIQGRTIAEEENIPRQFLAKILLNLRNQGLVKSTMGPGGGYELALPAKDIHIAQIVDAIEGPLDIDDHCILGLDKCDDKEHCALHEPWKEFKKLFTSNIATMSLNEAGAVLVRKRKATARRQKKK